ncbi:MAG: hypothetical protein K2X81_07900 [Candidatus Obscuribacterales bacterium]|nr:hypothetical protein [Candidatus Obscuribacterales bacterium]
MNKQAGFIGTLFALTLLLNGCSTGGGGRTEHYVSKRIQGESQRINLEEVQKAFWDTKGKDLNSWMADFEKKVNEIYEGKEVVSIDATRKDGNLVVVGYIDKENKEGYVAGDEKLFSIEQTGEAVNNEMPYRVSGYNDRPYYEGHHSFLSNPFLQAMLISHVMGGWGGRYHTPPTQVIVLRDHRDGFRQTPQYGQQQTSNQGFFSRFKTKASGDLESTRKMGSTGFSSSSSTEKKRSWGFGSSLGSSESSSSTSSSGWGGRRSSGGGLFGSSGGSRRGWGGRRR